MFSSWLASSSSSWTTGDWWAYGSAFVVFLGVVGETVADLTSWVKDKSTKRKLEIGSALILILGLAGDLVSVHVAKEDIARITREAGDAKKSADNAAKDAVRANREAGTAQQRADEVGKLASAANASAKKANGEAVIAQQGAKEVGKQAEDLRATTEKLAAKLSAAEKAELEARQKMVEMEQWVSPRIIPVFTVGNTMNFSSLIPFSETNAIIEYVGDFEARRAARQIDMILKEAGWKHRSVAPLDPSLETNDGVAVWSYLAPQVSSEAFFGPERRSSDAAEAVADFLTCSGWQEARAQMGSRGETPFRVPIDSIRIWVGLKPNPYFVGNEPAWAQAMHEKATEAMKRLRNGIPCFDPTAHKRPLE